MRTRSLPAAALTASLALLLGGCTSGDAPPVEPSPDARTGEAAPDDGTGDEDADEDGAGTTAPPAARGYLCRYITQETQETVAGGELEDPYEVTVQDDPESWVCEARDGDRALVRVSILRGEGIWDTQRDLAHAEEHGEVEDGSPWLGESYTSARRVTGLTMCAQPDGDGPEDYEPYALVVEALPDADEDVSSELNNAASAAARGIDQSIGCSPRMARGEVQGPTPEPTGD